MTTQKKCAPIISCGHSHFVLLTGDFNAKSKNWSSYYTEITEGTQFNSLLTSSGTKQLTTESKTILENLSKALILFLAPSLILL